MKSIPLASPFLALALLTLPVMAGCSIESLHHIYPIPFYDTTARPTWSPLFGEKLPLRIAILPFTLAQNDNPERREAARVLRESFSTALSRLRTYEIVPPKEVDRRLEAAGITAKTFRTQTPQLLGRIAGADTLLFGDLDRTANITLYVYSHTVYNGTFRLVDAARGEPFWTGSLWEGRRAGLLVEAFFVDMFLSQPENRKLPDAYRRVAESMVDKLIASIPEPTLVGMGEDAAADTRVGAAPAATPSGGKP